MVPAADQFLRFVFAPVLLVQGMWVRWKSLKLPEPPGARSGGVGGTSGGLRLLIVGDSSAAGVGADTQASALSGQLCRALLAHGPVTWHLEAQTGATTKTSLAKLAKPDRVPEAQFDIALLVHGVNDTTSFTSQARFKARQKALMTQLGARHGISQFVLSGVPPMRHFPLLPQPLRWFLGCHAERLDAVLAALAQERRDCTHVALDLPYEPRFVARDGFHPSEQAYAIWAAMVADTIKGRIIP